jgi:hypothetical protein
VALPHPATGLAPSDPASAQQPCQPCHHHCSSHAARPGTQQQPPTYPTLPYPTPTPTPPHRQGCPLTVQQRTQKRWPGGLLEALTRTRGTPQQKGRRGRWPCTADCCKEQPQKTRATLGTPAEPRVRRERS